MAKKQPLKNQAGRVIKGNEEVPGPAPATRAAQPAPTAARAVEGPVKVRATQPGYYDNQRRRTGDVFTLNEPALFSEKWMERVDPRTPEKATKSSEHLKQQHDELLASRVGEGSRVAPGQEAKEGDNPIDA